MSDAPKKSPVRVLGMMSMLAAVMLGDEVLEPPPHLRERPLGPDPMPTPPPRAHVDGHSCGGFACLKDPSGECRCWCGRCKRARTARANTEINRLIAEDTEAYREAMSGVEPLER